MVTRKVVNSNTLAVLRNALIADATDDLVLDVALMLRKMSPHDRLLLINLATGVPLGVLKRFYSTNVYVRVKNALEKFEALLEEYREGNV